MNSDLATVLNTVTGRVGVHKRSILNHPVFGKSLVEVEPGTKSRSASLHKSQTVEEYKTTHPTATDSKREEEVIFDPIVDADSSKED